MGGLGGGLYLVHKKESGVKTLRYAQRGSSPGFEVRGEGYRNNGKKEFSNKRNINFINDPNNP